MDHLFSECLICKAKSIISSLCGIMLWASRFSIPMQIPHQYLQLGLKTLIYSEGETPGNLNDHGPGIVHSYMISSSSSSPLFRELTHLSSQSSSSVLDDLIGTESGVCLISSNDKEIMGMEKTESYNRDHGKQNQRYCTMTKEYPPPIPLLARTGNLPGHMPWVLTRHYIDGKLVLREERVKHHEYFEAYRSNGRLILKLVPVNDTVNCCHTVYESSEELELDDLELEREEEEEEVLDIVSDGDGDDNDDSEVEADLQKGSMAIYACSMPKSNLERFGDFRKCFTYAGSTIFDTNLSHMCLGQSGSAPLSVRPMTAVM